VLLKTSLGWFFTSSGTTKADVPPLAERRVGVASSFNFSRGYKETDKLAGPLGKVNDSLRPPECPTTPTLVLFPRRTTTELVDIETN
jgi:hypothetical protein